MPTTPLLRWEEAILPIMTTMIHLSLQQGSFPDVWKEALVHPRLKDTKLDSSFANLRPVSNLAYISKLTEKAVFDIHTYIHHFQVLPAGLFSNLFTTNARFGG